MKITVERETGRRVPLKQANKKPFPTEKYKKGLRWSRQISDVTTAHVITHHGPQLCITLDARATVKAEEKRNNAT